MHGKFNSQSLFFVYEYERSFGTIKPRYFMDSSKESLGFLGGPIGSTEYIRDPPCVYMTSVRIAYLSPFVNTAFVDKVMFKQQNGSSFTRHMKGLVPAVERRLATSMAITEMNLAGHKGLFSLVRAIGLSLNRPFGMRIKVVFLFLF
jgi:hypothetical protein